MAAAPRRIRLEVFSDYTCPWCYVGWARLEKALASLPDTMAVDVEWRPFEIHPEVPIEGMPVEDLPYSASVWMSMQEALRANAKAEGLDVGKRPKVSNTHRALAAGAYVQSEEPSRFPDFHERLFKSYFAEGRDLGDPAVVDRVAAETGVAVERMRAAIDSGGYESALSRTSKDARRMGISGTPTFVFDRRFAVSGAQPSEVLIHGFGSVLGRQKNK